MIMLVWRQPDPPVRTRWRGPHGSLAVSALSLGTPIVPTLIGPPGLPGPQGPPGSSFSLDAAVIDGGTFA
jgi:hypothetical protein